ncbi:MAG: DUF3182 family protein, partial [Vicinamibacteria bacterium]
ERLAETLGARYRGDYDGGERYAAPPYFVPDDALEHARAHRLGIANADDLFGGVVPHAFVATKAITHGLRGADAAAPEGWSHAFAPRVEGAVLRGYTAFARDDALAAVRELLDGCGVRLKRCDGIGGGGQHVVASVDEAAQVIDAIDPATLAETGIVVEENLDDVMTYSVGLVTAGGLTLSYCGTQRTVRNGMGHEVYGGSTLHCVRGGFSALAVLKLPNVARDAVELARRYDEAALACYPGLYASRRNYDVARGVGADGSTRVGVLEQSWRVGGASGAEVRAMRAFLDDPSLERVRASTVELYGHAVHVPTDAFVYFRGADAHGTPLVKYATLATDADA